MAERKAALKEAEKSWTSGSVNKPKGNEFIVTKLNSEGNKVYSQADFPESPVVHFQGNKKCSFEFRNVTAVKILIEDCESCEFLFDQDSKILTGHLEVWSCKYINIDTRMALGTLQADMCMSLGLQYSSLDHLGQIVQAGCHDFSVQFMDSPANNFTTGMSVLKKTCMQDLELSDNTTQFITRFIHGKILTEKILRLANDFPTTARENEAFEINSYMKDKLLECTVESVLGPELRNKIDPKDKETVQRLRKEAQSALRQESTSGTSNGDRAEYKRKQGNLAFKDGNYQQAAVHYTESISFDSMSAPVWANRCQCWLKLAEAEKALADANRCLELNKNYIKAHFRKGVALVELGRLKDACISFGKVLELEPGNSQAKGSLQLAEMKLNRQMQAH